MKKKEYIVPCTEQYTDCEEQMLAASVIDITGDFASEGDLWTLDPTPGDAADAAIKALDEDLLDF